MTFKLSYLCEIIFRAFCSLPIFLTEFFVIRHTRASFFLMSVPAALLREAKEQGPPAI